MLRQNAIHGLVIVACSVAFVCAPARSSANSYTQTNLVSNVPGLASTTDPNLVNPWGVSFSGTSPFWVSDQGTGKATLYDGAGNITPIVVTVPGTRLLQAGRPGRYLTAARDST